MDQGPAPDSAVWSLRSRGPAHLASQRCLDEQRAARARCSVGWLFGADPLHPDAVSWYRDALAERRVGRILAKLGDEWRVVHAVPGSAGATDIDHLVIGPPGVFTLTTGGVIEAELEARAASRSLTRAVGIPVAAQAVILDVPAHATGTSGRVALVPAKRLLRHLRALPAAHGPDVVATIARAAEEWTTWQPFGLAARHGSPDDAFDRLHAQVVTARLRRATWYAAGVAALVAGAVAIASALPH